jgi:hypothetical protein
LQACEESPLKTHPLVDTVPICDKPDEDGGRSDQVGPTVEVSHRLRRCQQSLLGDVVDELISGSRFEDEGAQS